jgi:hypothetical protein
MAEDAKAIAETIALISAAGFFVYKIIEGYFYVDLSLSVSSTRSHSTDGADLLVITAKLKKGSRGSIRLHDMQARLTYGEQVQCRTFVGFHRQSYTTAPVGCTDRKVVNWDKLSESRPLLRLPPNEETEFSCYAEVPKRAVCIVEVAVLGGRENPWSGLGQWKASHVSTPLT